MEYFTVDEVAKRLKVTPLTVRRWLNNGDLDGTRLSAGRAGWRISEADLEAFLEKRREATRREREERDEDDSKKLAA
jgi:excisionase family DNA binding protein